MTGRFIFSIIHCMFYSATNINNIIFFNIIGSFSLYKLELQVEMQASSIKYRTQFWYHKAGMGVPAWLGKGQGAKEIMHNLAHERSKFWHNLVRKRHKIGHSLERK